MQTPGQEKARLIVVSNTPTNKQLRKEAVDSVRRTRRPEGMTKRAWSTIRRLMYVIAREYPVSNPSVGHMAAQLDLTPRHTIRLLRQAESAGLIVTQFDAGWKNGKRGIRGISSTSRYYIGAIAPDLTEPLETAAESMSPPDISADQMSDTKTPTESYSTTFRMPPPVVLPSVGRARAHSRRVEPGEAERQIGDEPESPKKSSVPKSASETIREMDSGRRKAARNTTQRRPPGRLAMHFLRGWQELQSSREYLAEHKAWTSKGLAIGYLNNTFLKPDGGQAYSEDQVEQIIDQFFDDLSRHQFGLKPGQPAFLAFTARWKPLQRSAMVPNPTRSDDERPLHELNAFQPKPRS